MGFQKAWMADLLTLKKQMSLHLNHQRVQGREIHLQIAWKVEDIKYRIWPFSNTVWQAWLRDLRCLKKLPSLLQTKKFQSWLIVFHTFQDVPTMGRWFFFMQLYLIALMPNEDDSRTKLLVTREVVLKKSYVNQQWFFKLYIFVRWYASISYDILFLSWISLQISFLSVCILGYLIEQFPISNYLSLSLRISFHIFYLLLLLASLLELVMESIFSITKFKC